MKAIIFDMDGVLIDSEPLYMKFVLDFFHQHQQKLCYEQVIKIAGSSSKETWRMLGEWWNPKLSSEDMEAYYKKYVNHEEVDFRWFLNPYVRYILPRLKHEGYRLAIASSSPMKEIQSMCEQNEILSYFDVLVSGEDFKCSKPDPEIYLHTMKVLGVKAKDCIIIEDSDYGIEAGVSAGAFVYAIRDERLGFHQRLAHKRVHDLFEVYICIQGDEKND